MGRVTCDVCGDEVEVHLADECVRCHRVLCVECSCAGGLAWEVTGQCQACLSASGTYLDGDVASQDYRPPCGLWMR